MSREGVIEFLGDDWDRVTALIRESLYTDIPLLSKTNSDILANSGKMLRPMVAALTARAFGNGKMTEDSYRFAAASELLHNATLLHDDVADRSDVRRGKPTVRAVLGPDAAVLVGDFWLSRTVEAALCTTRRDKVLKLFSHTLSDLSEGEMLQLQKSMSADTTERDYLRIIYCKTASLFVTACESAAISVDASEECISAARGYAAALGTAFQIRDDILDYDGGEELGKPVGADLLERKITLPLLGALLNSPDEAEIRETVRTMDVHPENAARIRQLVLERGGVEYAVSKLDEYVNKAVGFLDTFPQCAETDYLRKVACYNSIRRK